MKKTLLKGLTVVTLLLCLVTALFGCGGDKNSKPTTPVEPPKVELKHPFLIDDTTEASNFLKSIMDTFTNPFENKTGDLYTKTGSTLTINGTVVNLDIQAIVNVDNNNINLKEIFAYADAQNKAKVCLYFKNTNSDTDALIAHVKTYPGTAKVVDFNEKITIGNINNITAEGRKLGKPDFSNLLTELNTAFGVDLSNFIGTDLQTLFDQQIIQLVARMMYDENNKPLFTENNGKVSFKIDSNNINDVVKLFFERGNKVATDESYDPELDDKNGVDELKNNSDNFFKELPGLLELINGMVPTKVSTNLGAWANLFAITNTNNSIVPCSLDLSYDKTESGIENGTIKFNAAAGTFIEYPALDGTTKLHTGKLAKDIKFEATNLNISIVELGANKVDTANFENKTAIEGQTAINLVNFKLDGKIQGHKADKTVLDRTYTIDVDMNPFTMFLVSGKNANKNVEILNNAFNKFELIVKDGTKTVYSLIWKDSVGFVDESGKNVMSATTVANAIITTKANFSSKNGHSITSYIALDKVVALVKDKIYPTKVMENGKFTGFINIPVGFDTKVLEILNLSYNFIFGKGKDIDFVGNIFGMNSGVQNVYVSITQDSAVFNPTRA